MDEMLTRIENALEDQEFCAKASKIRDVESLKALFAEKDILVEDDFAQAAIDKMASIETGSELTEEEMEFVAGGKKLGTWLGGVSTIVGCTTVGTLLGHPIVGGAVGTYLACKYF